MFKKHLLILFSLVFSISILTLAQESNSTRPGTAESFRNTPVSTQPQDGVLFMDDFNGDNSISGLTSRGWVVLNQDGGGTQPAWFQPTGTVFPSYEGPDTGFVASNYQGANGFLIDHWLISPEITVTAGDTLSFWHRSPDGNSWDDSIYVRYSTTAGTTPGDFDVTWGRYLASEAGWARWTGTFNHTGTIRFAIQYYIVDGGPSGTYSNYLGIDLVEVLGVEAQNDLFISEYLEGSSNNKAIEIYNPTGGPVDLTQYRMVRANNGADTIQYVQPFYGTLNAGDVYVMVNPSADPVLLAVADIDTGAITFFNGDDFLGLQKNISSTWTTIDVIGELGFDPGTAWAVAGVALGTAEHTLVRKPEIMMGNTNWGASAGTDSLNSEWLVYPQNTFQYLGNHQIIPVELSSFTANVVGTNVTLNWSTASELNNFGFEIERRSSSTEWNKVGFVQGFGTTTETRVYSFTDNTLRSGNYNYRLKQVDFDGAFEYSNIIEVVVSTPSVYELSQNYPNPFNPSTAIKFNMPEAGNVKLVVYNMLGQEVRTLVNGFREAGSYTMNFDATGLTSGIYLYKIETNGFVQTRKMMLIK